MPNRATRTCSRHRLEAEQLATSIRTRRRELGLSQQALADSAGIAIATLRSIESGRTVEPGFFTIFYVLRALDLDLGATLDRVIRAADQARLESAEEEVSNPGLHKDVL